jgi:bacillithiol synthase
LNSLRVDIPIERMPGVSPLYRDYVTRGDATIHRRVGGFRFDAGAWRSALADTRSVDARLVARMVAENEALGASHDTLERLRGLADGRTRAVVTGQQPGVAGGPLLSLYKAATAIALAREIETRWKTPCVAVFWLGSDDDDFAEIRDLSAIAESLSAVSVRVDSLAHVPGRRVGDVAGSAVAAAWHAIAPFLPQSGVVTRTQAIVDSGDDLGRIAARVMVELTSGNMAVLDSREPLLREAGRETLFSFFDAEDSIRAWVRNDGDALANEGYHAQLGTGEDSGLFLVRDGIRQRIPAEARAAARAEFARDITLASPGVVARNLIQDAVFVPVAVVLGPAEIAYRAQIARAYDHLGVAHPVVFPRLSATFVPSPVRDAVAKSGVDATLLATDPLAWVAQVKQAVESPRATEAARAFEVSVRAAAAALTSATTERLDERAKEKLERRVADLLNRAASVAQGAVEQDALARAGEWPWLPRAHELFARDGEVQERFMSSTVPYAFEGAGAWEVVCDIAGRHVRDALDGRVLHRVYSR